MTIKELQKLCWQISEDHGWHDEPRTVGDELALIHSEVSEALEAYRQWGLASFKKVQLGGGTPKPEGVGSELADVVIRICDFCGAHGVNLAYQLDIKTEFNKTRPYRHGGKKL